MLVINDDELLLRYFREKLIVEGGYTVIFKSSPVEGMEFFKDNNLDVVIIKFDYLKQEDVRLVNELKHRDPDCILIAVIDKDLSQLPAEVLHMGIYGYVNKPINSDKLFFLIKKGAELHALAFTHRKLVYSLQEQNGSLQKQNTLLAKRIDESTKNLTRLYEDLRTTYMRTIKALAEAIDARDHYTHSHSENVAKYAVAIATEMQLSVRDVEHIRQACELHDVGKIGIEDRILLKPSALTEEEWIQVKLHPITGAQILEPLTFLSEVIELVRQHHEHFDGSGYPMGLKGEEIFLGARIIHIADAYDAMVSARSYRKTPLSKEEAIYEIKKNTGTQFDPKVAEAFLKIAGKV